MNAKDFIQIIEYTKTFNKPPKVRKMKKQKEPDLYEMLRKAEENALIWRKFVEDFEKTHKKDEKKPDKKSEGLSPLQTTILLTTLGPLLALGYLYIVKYMFTILFTVPH